MEHGESPASGAVWKVLVTLSVSCCEIGWWLGKEGLRRVNMLRLGGWRRGLCLGRSGHVCGMRDVSGRG
jgi:hypothetical protein